MAPPPQAAQHPPLTGLTLVTATISLALATFMNVLDTTIANVSIPTIAGNLSVSPHQGTWIITSYAVAMAIVVPLTGWLAKRFGEVRLFVICTALFSLTSWFCGLAKDFNLLLILRAVQGMSAGPMIPLSQTLLLRCYAPEKKGMALAFWSMTTIIAPIVGPILGGYITDEIGWAWIFYINIPVGIVSSVVTWKVLKKRESAIVKHPIDTVGLALLILGVGCVQVMFDRGHDLDWFDSNIIVTLAIIAVVALIFFLVWEFYEKHPVVDLSLFLRRNYAVATISLSLGYMAFFAGAVVFPLWLQTQMGYTATWAGLAAAPIGILTLILSPVVGKNLHRIDLRKMVSFAFFWFVIVSVWQANFNTDMTFVDIALPRFAQGFAMAMFFIPLTTISLAGLPPDRIASAAGLTNFSRILAGGFGTSLVVTLWDNRTVYHKTVLLEKINAYNPVVSQAMDRMKDSGIERAGALRMLEVSVTKQASMLATNDIFYLSAAIFFLLMMFIWVAEKVKAQAH